jgi:hypothetical protein
LIELLSFIAVVICKKNKARSGSTLMPFRQWYVIVAASVCDTATFAAHRNKGEAQKFTEAPGFFIGNVLSAYQFFLVGPRKGSCLL